MGVVALVDGLVMPPVNAAPLEQRPLGGHRAEGGENELHYWIGLEGSVRKQPVVPDGDSKRRQEVAAYQQSKMDPAESPPPKQGPARPQPTNRQHYPPSAPHFPG